MKKMKKLIMLLTMALSLSMLTGCLSLFLLAGSDDDNKESSQVAETRKPRERPVSSKNENTGKPQKKPIPRKKPIPAKTGNSSTCSGNSCNITKPNTSSGKKTNNDYLAEVKNFEFTTEDLDGRTVTSDIFKDYDVTVLTIWGSRCGRCKREMPHLQTIYEKFKNRNCNVIAVLADYKINSQSISRAKGVLNTAGVQFKCLKSNRDFMPLLRYIRPIPVVLFFDKDGNVIAEDGNDIFAGVVASEEELSQAMEKALRAVSK